MKSQDIPRALRSTKQWVNWVERDRAGKSTKVPCQPGGGVARANDPATWASFAACLKAANRFSGIGFVFASDDTFIGIDLDGCRNPETGELDEWAGEVMEQFQGCYAEISPSNSGIKIFAATAEEWVHRSKVSLAGNGYAGKSPGIEVYQKGRFFTVTGDRWGEASDVVNCDTALRWLAERFDMRRVEASSKPKRATPPVHAENSLSIIERAANYVAELPAAVAGQRGHDATFRAACCLVKGFGLSENDALDVLKRDFNQRCEPPWTDHELRHKVNDAVKQPGPVGELRDAIPELKSPRRPGRKRATVGPGMHDLAEESGKTEVANAARFIDRYHSELLYVPEWKRWLSWDGQRWNADGIGAKQRAIAYAESLWAEFGELLPILPRNQLGVVQTFVKQTNQRKQIDNFLDLASVNERIVCPVSGLNTNGNLLNVLNGTIELATGKLLPHDPMDRITQLANVNYDPAAECPKWLETFTFIFGGDDELVQYVQRLLGYSISGDTGEHFLPIAYGSGCNGKSTIWGVMCELLGDYATLADEELLLGDKAAHPTAKASLYQQRFVAVSEPERRSSLRQARVKELTGDRIITARKMFQDFWTFERTHTFWMSSNHLPVIDGVDEGIWRRIKLIPFTVDLRSKVKPIPDFDRWLVQNEGSGILSWLVRGYLDYRANGHPEPRAVLDATGMYRSNSDPLGDFLAEYCYEAKDAVSTAAELYRVYSEEYKGHWSKSAFGRELTARYRKNKPKAGKFRDKTIYEGVGIRTGNPMVNRAIAAPDRADETGVGPVGTSDLVAPIEMACPRAGSKKPTPTGPTTSRTPRLCPTCKVQMAPSPAKDGRTKLICPTCKCIRYIKRKPVQQTAPPSDGSSPLLTPARAGGRKKRRLRRSHR